MEFRILSSKAAVGVGEAAHGRPEPVSSADTLSAFHTPVVKRWTDVREPRELFPFKRREIDSTPQSVVCSSSEICLVTCHHFLDPRSALLWELFTVAPALPWGSGCALWSHPSKRKLTLYLSNLRLLLAYKKRRVRGLFSFSALSLQADVIHFKMSWASCVSIYNPLH